MIQGIEIPKADHFSGLSPERHDGLVALLMAAWGAAAREIKGPDFRLFQPLPGETRQDATRRVLNAAVEELGKHADELNFLWDHRSTGALEATFFINPEHLEQTSPDKRQFEVERPESFEPAALANVLEPAYRRIARLGANDTVTVQRLLDMHFA